MPPLRPTMDKDFRETSLELWWHNASQEIPKNAMLEAQGDYISHQYNYDFVEPYLKYNYQKYKPTLQQVIDDQESIGLKLNVRNFPQKAVAGQALRTGITVAIALAAADGPLPIGDLIAAGVLIGAGSYYWFASD